MKYMWSSYILTFDNMVIMQQSLTSEEEMKLKKQSEMGSYSGPGVKWTRDTEVPQELRAW